MKTAIKWLIKLLVTGTALYITFRKVNWPQTRAVLMHVHLFWCLIALFLFNLSQLISALRLYYFYRALSIPISFLQNLKLYYIGMFYNLFLPGGIGGDGYKIHYLYRMSRKSLKSLFTATLLDRLQGLWGLLLLISVFIALDYSRFPHSWQQYTIIALSLVWLVCAIYAALFRGIFPAYRSIFWKTAWLSLAVQICQLLAAGALLQGLGHGYATGLYLMLFLCSSIAAVIPFTIGGMGARELVFLWGAMLLPIQVHEAIAMSLLFFLLTAISSFIGAFLSMPEQPLASPG